jgi:hypothetical protein
MAYDTRIQNSGGGDFDTATSYKVMVNSRGFLGEKRSSYCGFSAAPIAIDEQGRMQRNYWYSSARTTQLLESPEAIGIKAAQRTLRRMGARPVKTQRVPVVFSPEIAKSIIGNIFEAANGDAIYRHAGDRRVWYRGLRRRGFADAAHGAGGERHSEELRHEYLHSAQTWLEEHRQCEPRAGGESRHRRA